jgi:integrase
MPIASTEKRTLTDRTLKSLRGADKPFDVRDTEVRGLRVRVMPSGQRSFVLLARYGGKHSAPTRRALGVYDEMSLEEAREEARRWKKLIKKGIDPTAVKERERVEKEREQKNTFRAVLAAYNKDKLEGLRRGHEVNRDLEKLADDTGWGGRPITEITALEVRDFIKQYKARGKIHHAHNLLGYIRRLFNWAIDQHVYTGLESSPCDRLKPNALIGKKKIRKRVLSDFELRVLWLATIAIGYPYGPFYQMLLLTGQRKSEVAAMRWSEIDLANKLWVIPAERMKMDEPQVIPLSDEALAILASLPRFEGDYVFSFNGGVSPIASDSEYKQRLDEEILKLLRENDPRATLAHFQNHDLRRTLRTRLSAIPGVPPEIRELVIGHRKKELDPVYDQYDFLPEKRFALDAWAARLRAIVDPKAGNVVELRAAQ